MPIVTYLNLAYGKIKKTAINNSSKVATEAMVSFNVKKAISIPKRKMLNVMASPKMSDEIL